MSNNYNNNNNNNKLNKNNINKNNFENNNNDNINNNENTIENNSEKTFEFLKSFFNNGDTEDLTIFLKFVFFDFYIVRNDPSRTKNLESEKDKIINNFRNKLNNFVNSDKNIQKNKSAKLLKKISENKKKIKVFYLQIKKKLKEILLKEDAENIKFDSDLNLKINDNIFEINEPFKFKIGELLLRILFYKTSIELNPSDPSTGTSVIDPVRTNALDQNKYYESYINDLNILLSSSGSGNLLDLTKKYPQFIFYYTYISLIGGLFEKNLDLTNIFNEKISREKIKSLYDFYKLGSKKKKKIKMVKRKKVKMIKRKKIQKEKKINLEK